MSESKPSLPNVAATLEHVVSDVEGLVGLHAETAAKVEAVEAKVESFGAGLASAGEGLLQDVIDFLHWAFPTAAMSGKHPPGVPRGEVEPGEPGVEPSHTEGESHGVS